MSPSKKANKKVISKIDVGAQGKTRKPSARSSRAVEKPEKKQPAKRSTTAKPREEQRPVNDKPGIALLVPASVHESGATEQRAFIPKQNSSVLTNTLRILSLLAVIGITIYIFSIREHVEEFAAFGYPGIFLIALLANATILLPAPGLAIVYAMGAIFHPLGVGFAAGTGGAIGELSGYLAGFSGQAVIERTDIYNRFKPWVDKYGGWAILVLSAIPNPFFDVAGIAAGIAKMPVRIFLFSVWMGQLIKMIVFAYAGKYSIEWISNLIR